MTTYHYNIELRDKDGKFYLDSKGNKLTLNTFRFVDHTNNENLIELICRDTFDNYKAICKEGTDINIEIRVFNKISNSFMLLYSFYGAENKFIKHF